MGAWWAVRTGDFRVLLGEIIGSVAGIGICVLVYVIGVTSGAWILLRDDDRCSFCLRSGVEFHHPPAEAPIQLCPRCLDQTAHWIRNWQVAQAALGGIVEERIRDSDSV